MTNVSDYGVSRVGMFLDGGCARQKTKSAKQMWGLRPMK